MKHWEFSCSSAQRSNLLNLAAFLESFEDSSCESQFSMGTYNVNPETGSCTREPLEATYECGTTACALGHGPAAGIIPQAGERSEIDWEAYADQAFGTPAPTFLPGGGWSYDFLFSWEWERVDDTPEGAAQRIRYMLEYGVPKNLLDQMAGDEPLCYRAPWS